MEVVLLQGFVDPKELNSIAAFYQFYTNGEMSLKQAATEFGISGLTAAFYVNSFRKTLSNNTEILTIESKL